MMRFNFPSPLSARGARAVRDRLSVQLTRAASPTLVDNFPAGGPCVDNFHKGTESLEIRVGSGVRTH